MDSGGMLGAVDAALTSQGLKEEMDTSTREGTVHVSLPADLHLRFELTEVAENRTVVRSTYFGTSRVHRFMPGGKEMFTFTLERIEREIRKWADGA